MRHERLVSTIAAQVSEYYKQKKPFHIYHGSTNSTRILSFKRSAMIDTSQLNRVLNINTTKRTAWVEPNVPMDKLVKATLKLGLLPKVVMEFPGITVGGGIQGGAGESSSFRYGCFNQICNRYEMILANGKIIEASNQQNRDLFHATAGSFGTLGVITAAEVQLIPAQKYVCLTYISVTSFQESITVIKRVAKETYDYIDGIMFGADHGVIIVGRLSNKQYGKIERFSRAYHQWYYLHAQAIDEQRTEVTETVPLTDYLFRYDRGAFWVGRYAFELFNVRFNRVTRWALDRFFHTRKLYQALQTSGASQLTLVQDLALPLNNARQFMEFIDSNFGIYPLWLCPLKPDTKSPLQSNNIATPLCINVGVWGNLMPSHSAFLKANKLVEQKLAELKGKKWFYAHSYYTEQEFWNRYDRQWYNDIRQKYHATNLPSVYEKIRVKKTYPIDLKNGAYRTMQGRAKLRIQD